MDTNLPNNKNFFDLPAGADLLTESMKIEGQITLPFHAPIFWWMNGSNNMRAMANEYPSLYFGGWSSNLPEVEEAAEFYGPVSMKKTQLASRQGKELDAYVSRSLMIAPITFRERWQKTDQSGRLSYSDHYTDGGRHHVQMLALLAFKKPDVTYEPWGPIVLSCKGYQAKNLLNCVKEWRGLIEKARKEHAPAVPAHLFWMLLGTFGKEPEVKMVGKSGAQSPITPVQLYKPQAITVETLRILYVGKAAAGGMVDYLQQAKDWAEAWKSRGDNNNGHSGKAEPEFDSDFTPEVTLDEIPF